MSLSSGRECAAALRSKGYDVIEVDAGLDLAARLQEIKPDAVFNALHGKWGEDGCVQGILEWLRIPYTHSGRAGLGPGDGQDAGQGGLRGRRSAGGREQDRGPVRDRSAPRDGAALRGETQQRRLVGGHLPGA